MHWNIRYDEGRNYLHVCQGGRYSVGEQASFLVSIFSSPFWQSGTPLVIDYRTLDMGTINDGTIATTRRMLTLLKRRLGDGRFALVCSGDDGCSAGRKFQTSTMPNIDAELNVFHDPDAAIDWATRKN